MIVPVSDPAALAPLLDGWEEGMLYAFRAGRMGYAVADDSLRSAQVRVGDFCFLAGEPEGAVAAWQPAAPRACTVIVPQTPAWEPLLARHCPAARRAPRYAFYNDS